MQNFSFNRQNILPVGICVLLATLLIFLPDLLFSLFTRDTTPHSLWQNLANLGLVLASMEHVPPSSEERWSLALESSEIGVWDWNTATNEMFYSPTYWEILGFKPDEANASVEDFDARVHPEDKPGVLDNTVQLLRGDVPAFSREYRLRCKDGSYKWVLSRGKVVNRSADGQPVRVVGTIMDISARKAAEIDHHLAAERIHHLANYDALTGLPNLTLLQERMGEAIASAQRNHESIALLSLDLDRFKQVNESLGQATGDQLLKLAAERLQHLVPPSGTVARHGGDEFHVLLPDLDIDGAAQMAQSVMDTLSHPYLLDGHEITITPSVGISLLPNDSSDAISLIKNAETAMFHAKENGRNSYQFFTPDMNASALQRMTLENSMRRALEQEEFLVYYQAQVDLRSGQVVGAEALLRWEHPEMDMVSPTVFIELAEESGVIVPLGEWMMRKVCRQIQAWQQAGERIVPVSVNLSSRQFRQQDLSRQIESILKENNVDPSFLEIELTESTVMYDIEEAAQVISHIKKQGIRVAIDDFGTGYSSLAYLKRFHIGKLKIDQSFVRELVDNADDSAIVRAIISMAHSLRLEVVAEGVETQKQLDFLKALNCDQIQGFFFSEALPPDEFATLLREGKTLPA